MFSRIMGLLVLIVVAVPVGTSSKEDDAKLVEGEWVSKTYENNSGHQGAVGVWKIVFKDGKMGITSGQRTTATRFAGDVRFDTISQAVRCGLEVVENAKTPAIHLQGRR